MSGAETILQFVEGLVLCFTVCYLVTNAVLIFLAFRPVLDQIQGRGFEDLDLIEGNDSAIPSVAILVPAFNEETTIVDTVHSLMRIDYPSLELVVINDGSIDGTRRVMREAFGMRRRDLPLRGELATADIRAMYEATSEISDRVVRLVMIDKENGGKSDAINAGLNASLSPYVLTIDADCILDPEALKQVVRQLQNDPSLVAVGGQVGVVNDCEVEEGRVIRASVPRSFVPLCQTVEYIRAFSLMRTGMSRLNALTISSGAFTVLRRDVTVQVGGFLSQRSQSRVVEEYVGRGATNICEDMEIVVRIHRHMKELGRKARVSHSPLPLVWTEVPSDLGSLSKQRRRWHRGLIEILSQHRRMIFDPTYGRIGLFALPYFLWFELAGPYIEAAGLFLLPLLALLGWLDPATALLITAFALGAGMLQSLLSILVSTWMEPASLGGRRMRSLLGTDTWPDRLRLVAGCVLTELGYRQVTVIWRLMATVDFLRGRKDWDKFQRKGFRPAMVKATVAGMVLASILAFDTSTAHGQHGDWPTEPERWQRRATVVVGGEQRDGDLVSWWTEGVATWRRADRRSHWIGAYQIERGSRLDLGIVLGTSPARWSWGGVAGEFRFSPGASFSPEWVGSLESEFGLNDRWTGSVKLRHALYRDLKASTWELGSVVYLPRDAWWSNHLLWIHSDFDGGIVDDLLGFASRLHLEWKESALRLTAQRGGESFLTGTEREIQDIRAYILGAQARVPIFGGMRWIAGLDRRIPERGTGNLYLHTGLERGF